VTAPTSETPTLADAVAVVQTLDAAAINAFVDGLDLQRIWEAIRDREAQARALRVLERIARARRKGAAPQGGPDRAA
jgi:hypothetical protein